MNSKNKILLTLLFLLIGFCLQTSAEEVATTLMRSTFKIQGNSASGSPLIGTVFILGQPVSTNIAKYVLVTAAHLLNDIKSEQATLFLRVSKGDSFEKLPISINIRSNGQPLWIPH
jgi:hypothetical protein